MARHVSRARTILVYGNLRAPKLLNKIKDELARMAVITQLGVFSGISNTHACGHER